MTGAMMANAVDAVMGKIEPDERKNGGSLRPPKGSRSFAILRVGKISGMGKVAAAAQHNLRERDTANARPEDRDRNIHLAGAKTTDELMKLWQDRAPEKIRKNAVHALEYIVTASPEKMAAMGQTKSEDYLRDALTWLEDKHGAENILSAVIHNDETTPHLQVMLIPIDERGKLNARGLVGGKAQLSAMQTDFAERVGRKHGLDRGIERSNARHETIKSFYGRATAVENLSFDLPERATGRLGVFGRETVAEHHERLSQAHIEKLKTVTVGFGEELDEKDRQLENKSYENDDLRLQLADTKLKLEASEAKRIAERDRRHVLEFAHGVADYEGDDRQDLIARFQKDYLAKCAHLPEETLGIVDGLLEGMGAKGFWHIEQDRIAEERKISDRAEAAEKARASHAIERLGAWEARSLDQYDLADTTEGTREVLGLLREATTDAQYDRFRNGDMRAISHITNKPLFAAQLLKIVEYDNFAQGYETSNETKNRMSDARDLVRSHFPDDRERGYENER